MAIHSLLYHDVTTPGANQGSGFQDPIAQRYKLTTAAFGLHLKKIAAAVSAPAVSVTHALERPRESSFLMTFDDGGTSFLTPIADILDDHGWVGHFFISTDFLNSAGFLTTSELQALHSRGQLIGSHSCSHPQLMSNLPERELVREWRDSANRLSDLIGDRVTIGSVPGGYYSRRVAAAAVESGINVLFNSEPTGRVSVVDGCTVLGRYSIVNSTSADAAAKLATGDLLSCVRLSATWAARKAAKFCLGSTYRRISERIWNHRRPGDSTDDGQ